MNNIYDCILAIAAAVVITIGIVQLIDYERQRKFNHEMYRRQLRTWFERKMYNYHSYGNINGDPRYNRSSFTEEYPEYDIDKYFESQMNPYNKTSDMYTKECDPH